MNNVSWITSLHVLVPAAAFSSGSILAKVATPCFGQCWWVLFLAFSFTLWMIAHLIVHSYIKTGLTRK